MRRRTIQSLRTALDVCFDTKLQEEEEYGEDSWSSDRGEEDSEEECEGTEARRRNVGAIACLLGTFREEEGDESEEEEEEELGTDFTLRVMRSRLDTFGSNEE